jgi:hypothetical protein
MSAVAAAASAALSAVAHLAATTAATPTARAPAITAAASAAATAAAARSAAATAAASASTAAPVARIAPEVAPRLAAEVTTWFAARLAAIGVGVLGRTVHGLLIHDARPFFIPVAKGCERGDTGSGSSWRRAVDSPETRSRPAGRMVSGGSDHSEETARSASAPREAAHSEAGRFLYQWDASPVRQEGASP